MTGSSRLRLNRLKAAHRKGRKAAIFFEIVPHHAWPVSASPVFGPCLEQCVSICLKIVKFTLAQPMGETQLQALVAIFGSQRGSWLF